MTVTDNGWKVSVWTSVLHESPCPDPPTMSVFFSGLRLAAGGAVSQLVLLIATPLVTRIYSPADFGTYGLFNSVLMAFFPAVSLGLHAAVPLASSRAETLLLLRLSLAISSLLSGAFALALACYFYISDREGIFGSIVLFLMGWVALYFGSLSRLSRLWMIKARRFDHANYVTIGNSIATSALRISIGFLGFGYLGLVSATSIGQTTSVFCGVGRWGIYSRKAFIKVFNRYRDMPLHVVPQQLMNAASQAVPVLTLAHFYGDPIAGSYMLAASVLLLPTALIAGGVGDAVLPEMSASLARGSLERTRILFNRNTTLLFAIGLIPLIIITLYGASLFATIFGTNWSDAGIFGAIIAPWAYVSLANTPSLSVLAAMRRQVLLSRLNMATLALRLLVPVIACGSAVGPVATIVAFSAIGVFHNMFVILLAKKQLKNERYRG